MRHFVVYVLAVLPAAAAATPWLDHFTPGGAKKVRPRWTSWCILVYVVLCGIDCALRSADRQVAFLCHSASVIEIPALSSDRLIVP